MAGLVSLQNKITSVDLTLDSGTQVCLRRIRHSDMARIEHGAWSTWKKMTILPSRRRMFFAKPQLQILGSLRLPCWIDITASASPGSLC